MHPNTHVQEGPPKHTEGQGAMTATCLLWDFLAEPVIFYSKAFFFSSICWIDFHCLLYSSSADPSLASLAQHQCCTLLK